MYCKHTLKATGRIYRKRFQIGTANKCKIFALLTSINIQQKIMAHTRKKSGAQEHKKRREKNKR